MTFYQPEKLIPETLDLPHPGKNATADEQGNTKNKAYNEMKREDERAHQKKDDPSHTHKNNRCYP